MKLWKQTPTFLTNIDLPKTNETNSNLLTSYEHRARETELTELTAIFLLLTNTDLYQKLLKPTLEDDSNLLVSYEHRPIRKPNETNSNLLTSYEHRPRETELIELTTNFLLLTNTELGELN